MNKRLVDLHNQTMNWVADNGSLRISDRIPTGYAEKFAELIVKECANQATWHQDTNAKDIGGELLKYFGIQE